MNALIFDCDGVLADTERDGHLPAFNQTFAEFGLPVRWSESDYVVKLQIGGGKERVASLLTPEFVREAKLPTDADGQKRLLAQWHERKGVIFKEIVASGRLTPRPGVARLARAVDALGWKLAVASTSAVASVQAVLETVVGVEFAKRFAVFAGDIVPEKKPAPDIYRYALEHLGVTPNDALVVEDSRNGLLAATRAGPRCIVTVSSFTTGEAFDEALLVVSSLGDPHGEQTTVLANRTTTTTTVGHYVTVENLCAYLVTDAVQETRAS
jgi:HAD superfamily hydrolase (TIGR01509 family)